MTRMNSLHLLSLTRQSPVPPGLSWVRSYPAPYLSVHGSAALAADAVAVIDIEFDLVLAGNGRRCAGRRRQAVRMPLPPRLLRQTIYATGRRGQQVRSGRQRSVRSGQIKGR